MFSHMITELDGQKIPVAVRRSKQRRRTVQLQCNSGNFVLNVPADYPEPLIQKFLEQRRDWIRRVQQKMHKQKELRTIRPDEVIVTEFYSLRVVVDEKLIYPKFRVVREPGKKSSVFHLAPEFFLPENQLKLFANLEKYLLTQMAKSGADSLIERTRALAMQHKIDIKDVTVKVQKSRLGYCTYDNRIMINARMLFSPPALRDYVICHELAHTRHKNHSKQFWAYLEKLYPGAKAADKKLRDSSLYSMRVNP